MRAVLRPFLFAPLAACGLTLNVDPVVSDGGSNLPDATIDSSISPKDAGEDVAETRPPEDAGPSCNNGQRDGDESSVDCGGSCAKKCGLKEACQTADDCDGALVCNSSVCAYPASCKALLAARPGTPSAVYTLQSKATSSNFSALCDMTADGGGWTLALKIDGRKDTFDYDKGIWTDSSLLAPDHPGNDDVEAKLASFNETSFDAVRLAFFTAANAVNTISIPVSGTSLKDAVAAKTQSNLGPDAWLSLVPTGALQTDVCAQGFSAAVGGARVRLGILGNDGSSCGTPDSYVGVGSNAFCSKGTRAGNVACWNAGNGGSRDLPVFAAVLVR
jgi:hypothetical protein